MTDPRQVVARRLDRWKRQLIDLTRRNRLLNYRPTKASTVEIVDELPQAILEQLIEGEVFWFDPLPNSDGGDGDAPANQYAWPVVPRRDLSGGTDIRRTAGQDLSSHHTDNRLQTRHESKRLERNLLQIHRLAESAIEEQGVNTLFLALGMLEWYESTDSDIVNRAPVLMVPVNLKRRDASSPFQLRLGEDEPILNPALVEKMRLDFEVELPELPELSEQLDFDQVFFRVRDAVSGFTQWRLTNDVALGLFSFLKFVMYRDLERNARLFEDHPVVRRICGVQEDRGPTGVPADVAQADLDEEMAPWVCPQVVDADSSQQKAILAVRRGHDLVIEGPPGTGKSQTITNLIAHSLADGKSVLFVSEKMAALEVVKTRLEAVNLGDFCLELHSHKTAKTAFVRELARALDLPAGEESRSDVQVRQLAKARDELRQYVTDLHNPYGSLELPPFDAIARLSVLREVPLVRGARLGSFKTVSRNDYDDTLVQLRELGLALLDIEDPETHSLRGFALRRVHRTMTDEIVLATDEAIGAVSVLCDFSAEFATNLGLRTPATFGDIELAKQAARVVGRSPGAAPDVLRNEMWNELSADVAALLARGRDFTARHEKAEQRFHVEILEADLDSDIDEFSRHIGSFVRFFKTSFWKCRSRLGAFRLPTYRPAGNQDFLADLKTAQLCRTDRLFLEGRDSYGRDLFGDRWSGEASDWDDLERFANWVVELRQYALNDVLKLEGLRLASEAAVDRSLLADKESQLDEALDRVQATVGVLLRLGQVNPEVSEVDSALANDVRALLRRLQEIRQSLGELRAWGNYQSALAASQTEFVGDFIDKALSAGVTPDQLADAFERVFLRKWLDAAFEDRPVLGSFQASRHEKHLQEFRELDRASMQTARATTHQKTLGRHTELLTTELSSQLQLLQREARKKRRVRPVRQLLALAPGAIKVIKPCFMMSPLSVAQYCDPARLPFDVLIFDEASQITPPDAIGSLVRAKQIVVVGDSKQLPPTNFFSAQIDDPDEVEPESMEELTITDDLESILDEAAACGIPSLRLKWHYRSQDESLIRFSNEEFYADDPLYTFPSASRDRGALGLQFQYVEDGVYEGGGVNTIEAQAVGDAVVRHIQTTPHLTLGVGTFGIKQQTLILDELERRRREDPRLEFFFARSGEAKFFVKNLENIQGDDRDVIFLSVTYGPTDAGIVRRNFGPINGQNGWRRLNVITTRAKKVLRVFSSMRADDISLAGGVADGVLHLQRFLKYAETRQYPTHRVSQAEPESPFEQSVGRELELAGYRVISQVGEAGYRIDLGILDPEQPGRFVCGIECDGASYHSAATVRDRDRLRQQVLEDRGWTIHRVWSTDWHLDRSRQVDRLKTAIEGSRLQAAKPSPSQESSEDGGPGPPTDVTAARAASSGTFGVDLQDSPDVGPAIARIAVPTYEFATPESVYDSDTFYTRTLQQVATVIGQVLEIEGPIHKDALARRVASFWGIQRAGSQVRDKVERATRWMCERDMARCSADFVWPTGITCAPVRSRDAKGVVFKPEHISPEEAQEAIVLLLQHVAPLLQDQIVSNAARLMGFRRTGHKLATLIQAALEDLIAEQRLRPGAHGLRLRDSQSGPTRSEEGRQAQIDRSENLHSRQIKSLSSSSLPAKETPPDTPRNSLSRASAESDETKNNRTGMTSSLQSADPNVWFDLSHWLREEGALRPRDRSLAYSIGRYLSQGWSISAAQARYARSVYSQGIQLGFSPTDHKGEDRH